MHIRTTPENLLVQFGYPVKEATLAQMRRIIDNTKNFDSFSKHIFSLSDELKHFDAIIAPSNSKDYLKIKCHSPIQSEIEAFREVIEHWSEKYKVTLKKVDGKETYYIIGHIE